MPDLIKIPAASLKEAVAAIGKLSGLVPVAKGQIAEVYVVLVCDTKTQQVYMEHARNGLRIRYLLPGAQVQSTTPRVLLCMEHAFFNAVRKDDPVLFKREDNTQVALFSQGGSKGTVTLSPPSSFLAPMMTPPEKYTRVPVDAVKAGLNSTLFSSQDPSMTATGALSRVRLRKDELVVVTYDSMSGAVYKREGADLSAELPETFDLTLPNSMMSTIFNQSDVPEISVGAGVHDMRFRTKRLDLVFPKSEYPIMPVEEQMAKMAANARLGFTVDTRAFSDAVNTNATYLSIDKDAMNLLIEVGDNKARVSVKSAKISHGLDIPVDNFKGSPFSVHCDISRLQTFLRMVRGTQRTTVLYENHRIFFQAPGVLFAFVES